MNLPDPPTHRSPRRAGPASRALDVALTLVLGAAVGAFAVRTEGRAEATESACSEGTSVDTLVLEREDVVPLGEPGNLGTERTRWLYDAAIAGTDREEQGRALLHVMGDECWRLVGVEESAP
ncbi:MAG: hypothetical protein D6705_05355 [Deltaproteobacteria bacterium]|nr:MAG: hypothetical protein D6705_05355 [Deltaproteobacteria bacterium]